MIEGDNEMANEKDTPRRVSTPIPLVVRLLLWQGQMTGKRELYIKVGRDGTNVSASFVAGGEQDTPLPSERRDDRD